MNARARLSSLCRPSVAPLSLIALMRDWMAPLVNRPRRPPVAGGAFSPPALGAGAAASAPVTLSGGAGATAEALPVRNNAPSWAPEEGPPRGLDGYRWVGACISTSVCLLRGPVSRRASRCSMRSDMVGRVRKKISRVRWVRSAGSKQVARACRKRREPTCKVFS